MGYVIVTTLYVGDFECTGRVEKWGFLSKNQVCAILLISRVLFVMIIYLAATLPLRSSNLPEN